MLDNLPVRLVTINGKCFDIRFEGVEQRSFAPGVKKILKRYPRLTALLQDTETGDRDPEWAAGIVDSAKQTRALAHAIVKEAFGGRHAIRKSRHATEFAEVSYYFELSDPASGDSLRVSVVRKGGTDFYVQSAAEYDKRLDKVLLNVIRRHVDSGALTFQHPQHANSKEEVALQPLDFRPQVQRNDREIRQFMLHTAYWLSYRYGKRYTVRFDSEVDLEYLGVTGDDIRRNQQLLEERGMLDSNAPCRGWPSSAFVKAYEERLFQEQSQQERLEEAWQEVEKGIEVPVVSLYVIKNGSPRIASGAAIVLNPHEDIGYFSEAPFPVAVAYYEDNAGRAPHLSRYVERALAAADKMMHESWKSGPEVKKCALPRGELAKSGWLDIEQKRIIVEDPVALSDWLGVEMVSNEELSL